MNKIEKAISDAISTYFENWGELPDVLISPIALPDGLNCRGMRIVVSQFCPRDKIYIVSKADAQRILEESRQMFIGMRFW